MPWILGILMAVLLVAIFASVFFYGSPYAYRTAPYYYYPPPLFGFFFFPFGAILFFIFIFFIFRVAFWPWRRGHYGQWRGWGDANEILKQRYARGEISKEQYEQMKKDIESH